jgi:hypothetical protein
MAHWKNFALVSWQARADSECARELIRFADLLIPTQRMFTVVHVVEETAGLPTSDGRDEFIASIRAKGTQHLACLGVLLPNAPVIATMVRTFARASRTLLRGELQIVVENDARALARGVLRIHASRTGVQASEGEFVVALDELRRLSPARSP